MDTGYDFIQPEFLNILLFQQKSLVIFPYVDVRHLHSLEIFAVGYNIVDLDTTALHNIKEILELGNFNAYSQNPSFFFITNVTSKQLGEIMGLDNVHCIINCNEDIKSDVNGDQFIFYNKKNNSFLNYTSEDLAFEKWLISSSKNISVLQDKILKIKTMATNIFTELNDSGNPQSISKILSEIDSQFWDKILQFTRLFYGIEVPNIPLRPSIPENANKSLTSSFSDEYDVIISTNKKISKEFTQLIQEYRSRKVNPANLELEQLYFPRDLYDYLRTHHWKERIDEEFLTEWLSMKISKCPLNEEDLIDFQKVFNFLGVSTETLSDFSLNTPIITESQLKTNEIKQSEIMSIQSEAISETTPSIEAFSQFKAWILKDLEIIEKLADSDISADTISYFLNELLELRKTIDILKDNVYTPEPQEPVYKLGEIHIHKIHNQEIRRMLTTAEMLFNDYKESNKDIDASFIIPEYSKALEAILDEKISPGLKSLAVKYRIKYDRKETSPDFNKKIGPLLRGKSISLGPWISIIKDINKYQKNSDTQEFLTHLKDTFDAYTLDTIKRACEIISPKRNTAVHAGSLTIEQVKLLRKRFITTLNLLIELLF